MSCTTRPESYGAFLASLKRQTEGRYELITIDDLGPLAALRNHGLRLAVAPVVCFLDDDTVLPPTWLRAVLDAFRQHPEAAGVSGPAIITAYWRGNRDLFRYPLLLRGYQHLFLDGNRRPGHITRAGAATTLACDEDCTYTGEVDYLEACNMSWRTSIVRDLGGFDEAFSDLGEWCEPDLARRVRQAHPGLVCYFTPAAALFHQPATGHATLRRRATATRLANYLLYASRWVKPHWRATAYRVFLRTYFAYVECQRLLSR